LTTMGDDELDRQIDDIGVVARVAPEDKVRLVDVLRRNRNIVAMTGDGVNDAPALKKADIGVAMGITGTEVTKEAADMILTDDNFATIVSAVDGGRALYDNLTKYVRFQIAALIAFIALFVLAGVFDVADGIPLTPLQVLWINFAIQVLLAIGLGFDSPTPGIMQRKPRPADAPIMPTPLAIRLGLGGLVAAIGTLIVVSDAEDRYGLPVALTMGLVTLSLMNVIMAVITRDPEHTAFSMESIANRRFNLLVLACLALTLLVTSLNILQRMFDTVSLSARQWAICLVAVAVTALVMEGGKFVLRRTGWASTLPQTSEPTMIEPMAGYSGASAQP
jgi:Ca2+-transporting ATPase